MPTGVRRSPPESADQAQRVLALVLVGPTRAELQASVTAGADRFTDVRAACTAHGP